MVAPENVVGIVFLAKDQFTKPTRAMTAAIGKEEKAAKKAGAALGGMGRATDKSGASAKKSTGMFGKFFASFKGAGAAEKSIGGLKAAVVSLGAAGLIAAGAAGIGALGKASLNMAGDAQAGIAKVATLGEFSKKQLGQFSAGIQHIARDTGEAGGELREALFQTISAGVPAAKAMDVLAVASRSAVGGFGDVTTAVDGITSALNAYNMDASEATRVADIFFQTNKLGKTTVQEIAASLSIAAPLAAAAGVELEELAGFVATLTQTGAKTNVVMTQLRSIIAAVIRPSDEAGEVAKKLGINFTTAGIRAQGFGKWLVGVIDKAGNSEEVLAKLFGRVEGLSAAIAIGGPLRERFIKNIAAMGEAGGESAKAFDKAAGTYDRSVKRMVQSFNVWMEKVGNKVLPAATMAANAIAATFEAMTPSTDAEIRLAVIERALTKAAAAARRYPDNKKYQERLEALSTAYARLTTESVDFQEQAKSIADMLEGEVNPALDKHGNIAKKTAASTHELAVAWYEAADASDETFESISDFTKAMDKLAAAEKKKYGATMGQVQKEAKAVTSLFQLREGGVQSQQKNEGILAAARHKNSVELERQARKEAETARTFAEGWRRAYEDFSRDATDAANIGQRVFNDFNDASRGLISDGLFAGAQGDMEGFADAFDAFGERLLRSATDLVADMIAVGLVNKGVAALGEFIGVPGFAEGGIVTKPTFAMIGEAGPEAVIPLAKAAALGLGRSALVEAGTQAGQAAAIRGAGEEGAALAGQDYTADTAGFGRAGGSGAAAAVAALVTLAQGGSASDAGRNAFKTAVVSFVFGPFAPLVAMIQAREALQLNQNRDKASAFVNKITGGFLGSRRNNATPEEYGRANIENSKRILEGANRAIIGALGAGKYPTLDAPTLGVPDQTRAGINAFFKSNPLPIGTNDDLLRDLRDDYGLSPVKMAALLGDGDEVGRFYTGDTVRRVHKGEHTLNLDHPNSTAVIDDAIEKSLRRVLGKGGFGGGDMNINLAGAIFADQRGIGALTDLLDQYKRDQVSTGG